MTKQITYKNIIFDVGHVLFGYDKTRVHALIAQQDPAAFYPLQEGIQILKDCHTQKLEDPSLKLFVLSNFAQRSFNFLKNNHPQVFDYFDGIVISGDLSIEKPDPLMYLHLLEKYNLKPHESIFIDDKWENVKGAQIVGIQGIICTDFAVVRQELIKLGVFK